MTRSCFRVSARACALFLVLSVAGQARAQNESGPLVERTFPVSVDAMQKALQQIGGFGGGKLPIVDGFVTATSTELEHFERPYYQYRVHLRPVDPNTTAISVDAMISAWYADPDPARSEYRSLPSNGRLESDLLDRLQTALGGSASKSTAGTPSETDVSRGSAQTSQASPTKAANLPQSSPNPLPPRRSSWMPFWLSDRRCEKRRPLSRPRSPSSKHLTASLPMPPDWRP